jgi:hypothetical protein
MTIARPTSLVCTAIFISSLIAVFAAPAYAGDSICEAEMTRAADAYDVPLGVLYAVGMTETGQRGKLHPYALNIAGRSYFATGVRDAVETFEKERKRGIRLIDLGCMQINHHYHGKEFTSVEDMLDPVQNVEYAAKFLKHLRQREGSWTLAVARYHAGPNNNPAQKRYVCAVIRNMVASGFGQWTANARTFCA